MRLSRIQIENFRNIAELDGSVVVVGENRVGKSNFVHALRLIFDASLPDSARKLSLADFWNELGTPGEDDIIEVVVIGVPDPQWSEAIKAVCTQRAGATTTPDEIIEFVAGQIARYKKPKHVVFVAQLPKNDKGEIDRASVKAEHGQESS